MRWRTPAGCVQRTTGGRSCTLPLSPCDMCAGAMLLYRIPRLVIGENRTHRGPAEEYLPARGMKLEILDDAECRQLMLDFIAAHPDLWDEDIGE